MKAIIALGFFALIGVVAFQHTYYKDQLDIAVEQIEKHSKEVEELKAKIKRINNKLYLNPHTPKPTPKEEHLFGNQYVPTDDCRGKRQEQNWVKCIDTRKKALYQWVIKYRKDLK